MKKIYCLFFIIGMCLAGQDLFAKITVESTQGEAAYKKGNQWLPLSKGQTIEEGTKISTGVKSWAVINIDGSSLKIKELTMMKVFVNQLTADKHDTHIGLKHGSLQARVAKIGTLKTSFKITTPVATSSVRGTEEIVSYGPRSGMTIEVLEGTVLGENQFGISNPVHGNSVFRLGNDEARPRNLLSDARDKSILKIHDPNITNEENQGYENNASNIIDNPGRFIPSSQSQRPSNVNIQISWE